jgi:hemin uptake protein HemP
MKLESKPSLLLKNASPGSPSVAPRRLQSEALLGGSGELVIEHKGRDYRLRLTQNGKLILTA